MKENLVAKVIIIVAVLFILFRMVIPLMISSDSTELCVLGVLILLGVFVFIALRMDNAFKDRIINLFNKKEGGNTNERHE